MIELEIFSQQVVLANQLPVSFLHEVDHKFLREILHPGNARSRLQMRSVRTFPGRITKEDDASGFEIFQYQYVKHTLDPVFPYMFDDIVEKNKIKLFLYGVADNIPEIENNIRHL